MPSNLDLLKRQLVKVLQELRVVPLVLGGRREIVFAKKQVGFLELGIP